MALFSSKTWPQWIEEYSHSHTHPLNKLCHFVGIPLIVLSLVWFVVAALFNTSYLPSIILFTVGWALQFIGHAFERKWPEFFRDWRFLFVGVRWWVNKIIGRTGE